MHNLNRSALHGIESNVRDIVEKGVTQKEKDYALINACRNNHTKVVKYLLDKGANVNCKYHRNKWNHMIGEVFDPKVKEAMQKKVKAALNGYRTGAPLA